MGGHGLVFAARFARTRTNEYRSKVEAPAITRSGSGLMPRSTSAAMSASPKSFTATARPDGQLSVPV